MLQLLIVSGFGKNGTELDGWSAPSDAGKAMGMAWQQQGTDASVGTFVEAGEGGVGAAKTVYGSG